MAGGRDTSHSLPSLLHDLFIVVQWKFVVEVAIEKKLVVVVWD